MIMTDQSEINLLDQFYKDIESLDICSSYTRFPSIDSFGSMDDRLKISCEFYILNCLDTHSETKLFIDRFCDCKDTIIEYIHSRISKTDNIILKSKYNYALFLLSKNNQYCQKAIDGFLEILAQTFSNIDNIDHGNIRVYDILEFILLLSTSIKGYKIDDVKQIINEYIDDAKVSNNLKVGVLNLVLDYHVYNTLNNEFKQYQSCLIELSKNSSDAVLKERCLHTALRYAKALQNDTSNQPQMRIIFELLGDNQISQLIPYDENNAMIPHQNDSIVNKAIEYYKLSGSTEKLNDAIQLRNSNKEKMVYPVFHIKKAIPEAIIEILEKLVDEFSSKSSSEIMFNFICGNTFNFISIEDIEKMVNSTEQSDIIKDFIQVQVDINGNHKEIDELLYKRFQAYGLMQDNIQIRFIWNCLVSCVANKKITYKKLYRFLATKTSFGKIRTRTISGQHIEYSWLSLTDIGLKEFFTQLHRGIDGKMVDWRMCIDFLSIKFEGILRDILQFNGANIIKFSPKETKMVTLEQLLRIDKDGNDKDEMSTAFFKTYDREDLALFQYVFSSIAGCLNVRNDIAHCYYVPQQYTAKIALLVFLCILRLAKFIDK